MKTQQNNRIGFDNRPSGVGPSPKEWAKVIGKARVQIKLTGIRNNGEIDIIDTEKIFGINWNEYGQTDSHINSSKGLNVDGGRRVNILSKNQQFVKNKLLSEQNLVESIYLYNSNNTDFYIIKTIDDKLDIVDLNDVISRIYWDIFDELPDYSFELEPIPRNFFTKERIPSEAIKLDVVGGI